MTPAIALVVPNRARCGLVPRPRDRHEGHVCTGGVEADVTFADMGHELDAELDDAYRDKYGNYPSDVDAINSPPAQDTTLKLLPR